VWTDSGEYIVRGFPNQFFCDSWVVGFWRTDHAHDHDGAGLDHRFAGIPGVVLAARRQGAGRPEVLGGTALFCGSQHHLARSSGKIRALEQRVEAVLAVEPSRDLRSLLRRPGGDERNGEPGADVRLHRGTRPRLGGRRKRGHDDQALGRSRGGFSTKIHLKVDLDGLPLAFHLTGGEASDSRNFEILLDLGPDVAPRAAITDKGYDSKANRDAARKRGVCPVIPYKSNAIDRPAFFAKILYKARARIEQAVGKLKRFKRVALRCEKTALNYGSFVALALGFILVKSVHMT
jgi:transposase